MTMVPPDQIGIPLTAAGLYWQQSKWNGRKTVPVILELFDSNTLRLGMADGIIFAVPATSVQAKFSITNILHLTVNGEKYAISGIGTSLSPEFPPVMVDYLQRTAGEIANRHGENPADQNYVTLLQVARGSVFRFGAEASAKMAADGAAAKEAIDPWRQILASAGAQIA
ncbi:hypothetical protein [Enemella evansiae]|uniref:hypothetical protein n=1 Tax=Enemella evansiae TaxID=2016499 RepID=UPI000B96ED73|nr:hypothetical protein [Enemella evansiae]OYO05511.1 hypothetical protein CGZ97_01985 [Enemella evansiae]